MESYWEDIATLAKMKKELSPDREITIPLSLAENICEYCENMAIYDQLDDYGDFYHKLWRLILQAKETED